MISTKSSIIIAHVAIATRLDRYLRTLYPYLTQGILQKALRQSKIIVNNKKISSSLRIVDGDLITISHSLNLADNGVKEQKIFSNGVVKLASKILGEYLIYSDEHCIAINKPAGLATQSGSKITLSINDALCYLNYNGGDFKLVHRLDKDTSGILLIAKNYRSAQLLAEGFRQKIIKKTYLALVLGRPIKENGEISTIIAKNKIGAYETMRDDPNGKLAITYYQILKTYKTISLIELFPITGRMHQLRFHSAELNCPIIGDVKYGNIISSTMSDKMLLHATNLLIPQAIFGNEIIIKVQAPDYFKVSNYDSIET